MKVAFLTPGKGAAIGGIAAVVEAVQVNLGHSADVRLIAAGLSSRSVFEIDPERRRLAGEVRAFGADVVHTHGLWVAHSRAGADLVARDRLPEVISPHGMLDPWAMGHRAWKKKLAWLLFERGHLQRCRAVHALCEPERAAVRALGIRTPIALIPNGVRCPDEPVASEAPWTDAFGDDAHVLLFLGRMHPKKGLEPLISAWAALADEIGDTGWKLALLGWDDGGCAAGYEEQIKRLKVEKTCRWFGPAFGAAKDAAFARAKAFVLPSYSEGLPMTVLEAWANKLPVLMTPECNLPEGFAAGAAVQISTDVPALTAQLREFLLMKPAAREAMGAAGLALVKERFTWEKVTAQYLELYRWILGGGTPPSFVSTP